MRSFKIDSVPKPILAPPILTALRDGFDDIEIGAGQGLHAIRYSIANPNRRILAIERTHTKFARFLNRCGHHPQITNLVALHADAVSIFSHFIQNDSIKRVFLLYPNPYPKAKHRNLRWHNSPFMSCLHEKLKIGGELYLSTNLGWYNEEAKQALIAKWRFQLNKEEAITDPQQAQTHFEKKYLQRGETCYRLLFKKIYKAN